MSLIDKYCDYLRYERELATQTLSTYRRSLDMASAYFDTELAAQNQDALQKYLNHLRMQGLTAQTLSRHRAALRSYFTWLKQHGHMQNNPADSLIVPKVKQKVLPKSLSPDDINLLLSSPDESATHAALRNHALFELIYSSGLRLAEIVSLNIQDVYRFPDELIITGKGNKDRRIFIGTRAKTALKRWLAVRENWAKINEPALFVSQRGSRLTPRGVELQLHQYAQDKLPNRNITPHMLRHSFASHLLQSSANIRAVQEMLGHSDLSTTQKYTHLDFQHLAKIYDQAHPKARKKNK